MKAAIRIIVVLLFAIALAWGTCHSGQIRKTQQTAQAGKDGPMCIPGVSCPVR